MPQHFHPVFHSSVETISDEALLENSRWISQRTHCISVSDLCWHHLEIMFLCFVDIVDAVVGN